MQWSRKKGARLDLTGQTFGDLTAIKIAGMSAQGKTLWECQCSCGKNTVVDISKLRNGHTRSCGCLKYKASFKHGYATRELHSKRLKEYGVWEAMRQRCQNSNNKAYKNYGGRGIQVCQRWNSFKLFLQDMGARPSSQHTLERIHNDQDYCPSNCKWATRKEQQRNRRGLHLLFFRGQLRCLVEISELCGVPYETLRYRIRKWGLVEKTFL